MPSIDDWNVYLNFVILAVTGRMGEADALMRSHRDAIRRMATWMGRGAPGAGGDHHELRAASERAYRETLWRGLLLEPGVVRGVSEGAKQGEVEVDRGVEFVSFSLDRDVACWFADPRASVSGAVMQVRPTSQGWIAEFSGPRSPEGILFAGYREVPLPDRSGRAMPLAAAAHRMLPREQARQFEWNLQTQQEVIIDALAVPTLPIRRAADACGDGSARERRLGHPAYILNPRGEYTVIFDGEKVVRKKRRTCFAIEPIIAWGERTYCVGPDDTWIWLGEKPEEGERGRMSFGEDTEKKLLHQAELRGKDPLKYLASQRS